MSERHSTPKPEGPIGSNDVVTSADQSQVGSLLTDLLGEAQREVALERARLADQKQRSDAAAQRAQRQEEALHRERLQAELVAETRRRNEVFSRLERQQQSAIEPDGPLTQPVAEPPMGTPPATGGVPLQRPVRRSYGRWAAAAALVLIAGVSAALLASSQPEGMPVPSVAGVADSAIGQAKLKLVQAELVDNKAKAAAAANALERAKGLAQRAATEAKKERELRKAQEAQAKALQALKARKEAELGKKKPRKARPPRGQSPKIDLRYFSDPK